MRTVLLFAALGASLSLGACAMDKMEKPAPDPGPASTPPVDTPPPSDGPITTPPNTPPPTQSPAPMPQ